MAGAVARAAAFGITNTFMEMTMEYAMQHEGLTNAIFDGMHQFFIDISDDGSMEAIIALGLLRTTLLPGVRGPELAQNIMCGVAEMFDYLVDHDDTCSCAGNLPEDLKRRLCAALYILRPLLDRQEASNRGI